MGDTSQRGRTAHEIVRGHLEEYAALTKQLIDTVLASASTPASTTPEPKKIMQDILAKDSQLLLSVNQRT